MQESPEETTQLPEKTKKTSQIVRGDTMSACPLRYEYEAENPDKIKRIIVSNELDGAEAFKKVYGTCDLALFNDMARLSTNAMGGASQETKQNVLMQALTDSKPKDAMEAKLIAQAHVLFTQGMRFISFADWENRLTQQAHCMKFALQLLRLHNETLLALDKLRRGGEQKVIVQHQHLNVGGGGKAIVNNGNMNAGGGANTKTEA